MSNHTHKINNGSYGFVPTSNIPNGDRVLNIASSYHTMVRDDLVANFGATIVKNIESYHASNSSYNYALELYNLGSEMCNHYGYNYVLQTTATHYDNSEIIGVNVNCSD
jgi:hypothetical protein